MSSGGRGKVVAGPGGKGRGVSPRGGGGVKDCDLANDLTLVKTKL